MRNRVRSVLLMIGLPTTDYQLPTTVCSFFLVIGLVTSAIHAQTPLRRQMENLGRGVVAINQGDGKVFVSWRLLGTDPDSIAFNLYRTAGGGAAVNPTFALPTPEPR